VSAPGSKSGGRLRRDMRRYRCHEAQPMSQSGRNKNETEQDDELAKTREREMRDLIDQVEKEKSGKVSPAHESAHDFVERRMREKAKKPGG
jgi:hypothetical protein